MAPQTPLPAEIDRTLLDADGRVAGDHPCVHCRYDLRTLAAGSLCPECGRAVADSLRRFDFDSAPEDWLRNLAAGARWLMAACLATLITLGLAFALPATLDRFSQSQGPLLPCDAVLGLVLGPLAGFIGGWRITRPDPRTLGRGEGLSLRRATRLSLLPMAIPAFAIGPQVLGWLGEPLTATLFWASAVAIIFSLIVLPLLLLRHVGCLLRRGGNQELAQNARRLFALLLIAYLIGIVSALTAISGAGGAGAACSVLSLGIGYLLFLVGCIRLYYLMGRFLSGVADREAVRAG